jgi:hypothetical protein
MKKTKLSNIHTDDVEKDLLGPEDNVTNMNSPEVVFDLKNRIISMMKKKK